MLLALAGVLIAHDLALFQDIELGMVIAAPSPTYSMNQGQASQCIAFDILAIRAQVFAAAPSQSIGSNNVPSGTTFVERVITMRTACTAEPTDLSSHAVHNPETVFAPRVNGIFSTAANDAIARANHVAALGKLTASTFAYDSLGYPNLNSYSTDVCTDSSSNTPGRMSIDTPFGTYPSVNPGTGLCGCDHLTSVTDIKLVSWGSHIGADKTINKAPILNRYTVRVAHCNGYQNKPQDISSGFALKDVPGRSAILAPYDIQAYNTSMTIEKDFRRYLFWVTFFTCKPARVERFLHRAHSFASYIMDIAKLSVPTISSTWRKNARILRCLTPFTRTYLA